MDRRIELTCLRYPYLGIPNIELTCKNFSRSDQIFEKGALRRMHFTAFRKSKHSLLLISHSLLVRPVQNPLEIRKRVRSATNLIDLSICVCLLASDFVQHQMDSYLEKLEALVFEQKYTVSIVRILFRRFWESLEFHNQFV